MYGKLIINMGPMFSGKTEALNRYLTQEVLRKKEVICFRLSFKYFCDDLKMHNGGSLGKYPTELTLPKELVYKFANEKLEKYHTIAIDEAQFIQGDTIPELLTAIKRERKYGKTVILSGFNLDYTGKPFFPAPFLFFADEINVLHAVCQDCGDSAGYSYKLEGQYSQIDQDAKYVPLCHECYLKTVQECGYILRDVEKIDIGPVNNS